MSDGEIARAYGGETWRTLDDARRIRDALNDPTVYVHMHCFNEADRDEIAALLTPEERKRVRFFWLRFPARAAPPEPPR